MDRQLRLLTVVVIVTGSIALGAGSALGAVHCAAPSSPAETVCSCDDTHTGSTAIQDAVNHAAAGDTVCVGTGIYNEQVTITKPLALRGNSYTHTIIQPSSVVANTTNLATGEPIAAIVLVDETTGVAVTDLTVDGGAAGDTFGCVPGFAGIFYRASSGSIERTLVINIVHPSRLGCQDVLGIFVQSDPIEPGPNASVTILDSWVAYYGKNGITANELGTSVAVQGGIVSGLADVPGVAAQNGIQIAFGARGTVTGSLIGYNNSSSDQFLSCGVLYFQARGSKNPSADTAFYLNEEDVCRAAGGGGSSLHAPSK